MANGLTQFWRDIRPETLSWEQVVRYRPGNPDVDYIGTLDWRAVIKGRPIILDLKTTGSAHGKGKYFDQWRLQLAAYRYANEAVCYDDADREVSTAVLPDVDGAAIVHLYKDGLCELQPVQAGPREHEVFLALRRVFGWRSDEGTVSGAGELSAYRAVPL